MIEPEKPTQQSTPIEIIANVTRVVTKVVDRLTGDRADYPLLVAAATVEALKAFGLESRIMYGQSAWVEVMEDHSLLWAGCWGKNLHFWVGTAFGETVDLNTSVAFKKRAHDNPALKALYSPPILWSREVPSFYRYQPEGVAELELTEEQDHKRFETVCSEIAQKCGPKHLAVEGELDFPNEAILCPNRRLLDDTLDTFKHFDRALSVRGIPDAPF
jgi:ribosomal protein S10